MIGQRILAHGMTSAGDVCASSSSFILSMYGSEWS